MGSWTSAAPALQVLALHSLEPPPVPTELQLLLCCRSLGWTLTSPPYLVSTSTALAPYPGSLVLPVPCSGLWSGTPVSKSRAALSSGSGLLDVQPSSHRLLVSLSDFYLVILTCLNTQFWISHMTEVHYMCDGQDKLSFIFIYIIDNRCYMTSSVNISSVISVFFKSSSTCTVQNRD